MKNVLSTLAALTVSCFAAADTITVCLDGSCDYTDIQEAINAASDGDVIEIAAGTYYPAATIDTLGKAVTLRGIPSKGKDDALTTVIDGQGSIRVLTCNSGEGDQCPGEPDVDSDGDGVLDCLECPGDITANGFVDAADLGILLAVWGTDGKTNPDADVNSDGTVDGGDLGLLLNVFNAVSPPADFNGDGLVDAADLACSLPRGVRAHRRHGSIRTL
jgi:hypothetical protein